MLCRNESEGTKMARETWRSPVGFMLAAAGSAVGLANIWRFPYIVGNNGGGVFVVLYLFCLLIIGVPVFIAEILIGRETQKSPSGAFKMLGKGAVWPFLGKVTIFTGFVVSSFYSAVAGWILGYLVEAIKGNITIFTSGEQAATHYQHLVSQPLWTLGYHLVFAGACTAILVYGVKNGIERCSKVMMPMLFVLLIILVIRGITLPNAGQGLQFLLTPDWSKATPTVILTALGQAFFTLSLGQGTMVTYGCYLRRDDNIIANCAPVVLMDTLVSLFAAIAVMTIVFSAGLAPTSGPSLLFQTLPLIFSKMIGGFVFAGIFFLLVTLAAITSEISAMEPVIAYLVVEKKWSRRAATLLCGSGVFIVGIPSALSFGVMQDWTLGGATFFDWVSSFCTNLMIPLGGFFAVVLVGWVWGTSNAIKGLRKGAAQLFARGPWLDKYFSFCFKYAAPILIIFVFLHKIGIL